MHRGIVKGPDLLLSPLWILLVHFFDELLEKIQPCRGAVGALKQATPFLAISTDGSDKSNAFESFQATFETHGSFFDPAFTTIVGVDKTTFITAQNGFTFQDLRYKSFGEDVAKTWRDSMA